jgi:hypothetical protein
MKDPVYTRYRVTYNARPALRLVHSLRGQEEP